MAGVPTPKSVTLAHFLSSYEKASGRSFNDDQRAAVSHASGPLFVMAGPGSGKSEVMVGRALKLVLVDGYAASSLLLTTFTEKAARNLQDRVTSRLLSMGYTTALDGLRVGTLHSLCDRVMREFRYTPYADTRLLDGTEQGFFIYSKLRAWMKDNLDDDFWESFRFLNPQASLQYGPNRWQKVSTLMTLVNRVVDEDVDLARMARSTKAGIKALAEAVKAYHGTLVDEHRTDFSTLQIRFREFLESPQGKIFLEGSKVKGIPALGHVLVDEYQDTNPVQESIYFRLAAACAGNITIVGDDDQALYRFRGGTVECLVRFGERCKSDLKKAPKPVQLKTNYRSVPAITQWAEKVLLAQPAMKVRGARAPKKPMQNKRPTSPGYQPVSLIVDRTAADTANHVAQVIKTLIDQKRVQDPSQIVVLLRSTKESPRNAGPLCQALADAGISFYNPRSKAFLEVEEIAAMLGALIEIVDVKGEIGATLGGFLTQSVASWRAEYAAVAKGSRELQDYVQSVHTELQSLGPGEYLPVTLRDLFYRVLSRKPFSTWQDDPTRTFRLGQLSAILESFSSVDGDTLRVSEIAAGRFSHGWLRGVFYPRLIGYLHQASLDDPEDVDHQILPGRVQVMTVHQSKGLEFPVVFVGSLGTAPKATDATYVLEDLLVRYSRRPRPLMSSTLRAFQDLGRFYYVAYTRAENALILFGHASGIAKATVSMARV